MLDKTARKYLQAARQHFTAAEMLLDREMNLPAVYLAGYTVECALKALIIERTPVSRRAEVSFRGKQGHDYESLKRLLKKRRCEFGPEIAEYFRRVSSWSVDLRYDVGLVPTREARSFIGASKAVLEWITRSI